MKNTPSMLQYRSVKERYKDCIVFFRMGDFYEAFEEDAYLLGKVLDIVVTSRDKGEDKTPMAGIPHHALMTYLPKVIAAGYKVALCEQLEDPKTVKGIVKRDVVKVITPGTVLESEVQNPKQSNYILSFYYKSPSSIKGIAYMDVTNGQIMVYESKELSKIIELIKKIKPSEIILSESFVNTNDIVGKTFIDLLPQAPKSYINFVDFKNGEKYLLNHFKVISLKGFLKDTLTVSISAAGALLKYVEDNQKGKALNVEKIEELSFNDFMYLDPSTINNLEIFSSLNTYTISGNKKVSLIDVIDETKTSLGARRLRYMMMYPLINKDQIEERLNTVNFFFENSTILKNSCEILSDISDIERINARISFLSESPKDLVSLKFSLIKYLELIKSINEKNLPNILNEIVSNKNILNQCGKLINKIDSVLEDNNGDFLVNSNIVKPGIDKELDELKDLLKNGRSWIKDFQAQEIKRSGINSLKVKYNKVFGYYIEISNMHKNKVPDDYIRKQTLVNCERYITEKLKEKEDLILNAQDKITAIEIRIFNEFKEYMLKYIKDLKVVSDNVGLIDVLSNFAFIANKYEYSCPIISSDSILKPISLKEARHPVIERNMPSMEYISNDVYLDCFDSQISIITGPNMAGKSSILRLTALIVLLAQIGCFVPAKKAEIYLTDRIFSRVGARDNLATGESTFLVEMNETANILNNATSNSLIILDEIGRGTSTYDGVSIAYSVIEYIHEFIGAKTMFATHYHELIDLENLYKKIKNYNVSVKEEKDNIVFLRKFERGGTDKSYGIHVAKIAGVPGKVINRAKNILGEYEKVKDEIKKADIPPLLSMISNTPEEISEKKEDIQYETFLEIRKLMEDININNITPIDGLNILFKINNIVNKND